MSGNNDKFVGRSVAYFYSLNQDPTQVPNDFVRLGSVRDKEFGTELETVDATADTSSGGFREYLTTYKAFNPSASLVVDNNDNANQKALEEHVINDPNSCGWLRIVRPLSATQNRVYECFVIFGSYTITATYDTVSTASMSAQLSGGSGIILTDQTV